MGFPPSRSAGCMGKSFGDLLACFFTVLVANFEFAGFRE